jgi:hypothetical protein
MASESDGQEWLKRQYVEIYFLDEECKHHAATENQFCQPMISESRWDFDGNHDVVGLEWEDD